MGDKRKIHQKPRAVRKLLEYHSCDDIENDDSPKTVSKFKFPPPPKVLPIHSPSKSCSPLWQSTSDMETTSDSQSDNGTREASSPVSAQHRNSVYTMRGYQSDGSPVTTLSRCLPPIGVFWDIENCQIPRGRSAVAVAQTIRDRFFDGYREVEFLVVCDVKKETTQVVKELNDAQVNLIHVGATSKNAADEKLRQSIRRFADIHGSPSAVILISGDINFAPDLCDLRHRKKVHVILIHNDKCSESLILCANEHYNFSSLVSNLPYRVNAQGCSQPSEVFISNLPEGQDHARIRHRLKRLAENCGGRVGFISNLTTTIRFPSLEAATRAQKRMDGEKVFGSAIVVGNPATVMDLSEGSPLKSSQNRKFSAKMDDEFKHSSQYFSMRTPTTSAHNWQRMPYNGNSYPQLQTLGGSGDNGLARSKSMMIIRPLMYASEQKSPWTPPWSVTHQNRVPQPKGRPILGVRDADSALKATNHVNIANTPSRERAIGTTMLKRTRADSPSSETVIGSHQHVLHHSHQNGVIPPRKCRTPSPYTLHGVNTSIPPPPIVNLPRREDMLSNFPVQPVLASRPTPEAVELYVTILDQSLGPLELKKMLMSTFKDYVMVLHVSVFIQTDGQLTASVKVPSMQAAQTAVTKLQKLKVSVNHIKMCYAHPQDTQVSRSQVLCLLSQVPGFRLSLLRFCELYEARYGSAVNIPSLYNMQDTCTVSEETCGLFIALAVQQTSLLPAKKICKGCAQATVLEQNSSLPVVKIKLAVLSKHLQQLVSSHDNNLPLSSLVQCYEAEFGSLQVDDLGVPLEQLVAWVSSVELYTNTQDVKCIRAVSSANTQDVSSQVKEGSEDGSKENVSPTILQSVVDLPAFCHDLEELLRQQPCSQLLLNQFIPFYHQYFDRQCRVADYGFMKLIDLLESIPDTVQIIGEGNKRTLVPTRQVQLRQFTSDLMRLLRIQSSKQLTPSQFPFFYERMFSRPFNPVFYGLCYLDDLLSQVTDGLITVTEEGQSCVIAIAKREQTKKEAECTQQFALEILELLSKATDYKMLLSKVIPAYQQHFKRPCRVTDYGFTKLVQLLNAVSHVVKLEDNGTQRHVSLTDEKKLEVLGSQVLDLISPFYPSGLPIDNIDSAFHCKYGYNLVPEAYSCIDVHDLLDKLHSVVKVCKVGDATLLTALDQPRRQQLSLRVRRVLMERPNAKMTFVDFQKVFEDLFKHSCTLETLEQDLQDIVKVSWDKLGEVIVQLTSLQLFARDMYRLLCTSDGRLALGSFEATYMRTFGTAVQPMQYGYKNFVTLLEAIPDTVQLRGKGSKKILILNKEIQLAGIILPSSLCKSSPSQDMCSVRSTTEPVTSSQRATTLNQAQETLLKGLAGSDTDKPLTNGLLPDLTLQCETPVTILSCTNSLPHIVAPDPSELPLPQLLTNKTEQQDIKINRGEVCVMAVDLLKQSCSSLDGVDTSTYLINNKRKIRLAAQFQTPIQLI